MFTKGVLKVSLPSSQRLYGTPSEQKSAYGHTKKSLEGIVYKKIVVVKGVLNYEWEIDITFEDDFPSSFATTEMAKAVKALSGNGFTRR